jgi:hypothetical protein
MKWVKKDQYTRATGEKYLYAFSKSLLLISSFDNKMTMALNIKDIKTAKTIAELIEK